MTSPYDPLAVLWRGKTETSSREKRHQWAGLYFRREFRDFISFIFKQRALRADSVLLLGSCDNGIDCNGDWGWKLHFEATRGLLATDHVILNYGQLTSMTPELAPSSPNYDTTPTG
ncbi:hypothetical protein TNCV_900481 [Trichonephila clavipes]|nr:hypothetical protein TNCV_900481 [Trichonephila clavipes]